MLLKLQDDIKKTVVPAFAEIKKQQQIKAWMINAIAVALKKLS